MDKKLLWFLNAQVCALILLTIYNLSKEVIGSTVTATGGSVSSTISVGEDSVADARQRGYFTAKEYADFKGVSLETVYRRIEAGVIPEAQKVNHRWQLPCD